MSLRGPSSRTLRTVVFWTHLVTGITAGAVILVMSLTGVLLTYEPQLVAWAERDLRHVTPPSGAARRSLDAVVAQARPGARPVGVSVQADPTASVRVSFGRDDVVFLDPYTGASLGTGSTLHRFMHAIEEWHRRLGSRDVGRHLTGAANLAFLGLTVTGLYLWWPRIWSLSLRRIAWFRRGLRPRARDLNWHHVVGAWCAPVLVVLTVTGTIMSYQWASGLLYTLSGTQPPPSAARTATKDGDELAPLDTLVARAAQQSPRWVAITLRIPPRSDQPVTAFILEPAGWHPSPRSQLRLDARTADVIAWEPVAGYNVGRVLRMWVRVLHTGEAGGVLGQTAAGAASAGGVVLVWTGARLTWRRFRSRRSPSRCQTVRTVAS